ncbi:hypothetical protein RhiirC2_795532 [Rhizophagus irregularis]|uniref:Uncharacterized protein n=1 Tax=Rhizophagus irregularis TaxID=588596 RepID=A0A2N1MBE2_9GLOM|nr:hypothetical protein RhiirC2_795532 [Rhizophagus irregularis]
MKAVFVLPTLTPFYLFIYCFWPSLKVKYNGFQPSLEVEYDGGIIWTTSSKLLLDVDFDMDLILVQTLKPYAKPDERKRLLLKQRDELIDGHGSFKERILNRNGSSWSTLFQQVVVMKFLHLKIYLYLEIVDLPNCNDDATDVDGQRKENEMENVRMNRNDNDATDVDGQGKENEMENIWIDENEI